MINNESGFSSYMNKFVKSILALGITSALGISAVNAATYQVIDKGDVSALKYTYSQQENNNGEAAISGTDIYNFPVQFQYFDEDDYDSVVALATNNHEIIDGLESIENEAALRAGNPTANDLSWVIQLLKARVGNTLYQQVGDIYAMTNFNGDTELLNVFDEKFVGSDDYTRSTQDYISGITNEGWVYGNASAPYLPFEFTDSDGDEITYWARDFTTRGFFSPNGGTTIIEVIPPSETDLPEEQRFGGESAILDVSDSHIAVGYASTSIDQTGIDAITDDSGGCADPDVIKDLPYSICVQRAIAGAYNLEAIKWTIDEQGILSSETLGQLVTPHEVIALLLVSLMAGGMRMKRILALMKVEVYTQWYLKTVRLKILLTITVSTLIRVPMILMMRVLLSGMLVRMLTVICVLSFIMLILMRKKWK